MTGDDICGFSGSAWDNLCARWLALGSFFPFSRNHRTLMTPVNQEPYAWGINSYTYKLGKMALKLRYSLLRYFYSELFLISLGEFGSFFKPVFFEYPNDLNTYENISDCAMIGRKLLLYPLFQNETNDIEAYFPNDDWNYMNGSKLLIKKNDTNVGTYLNISGEFNIIHLYIRGGNIIPFQDSTHVRNTYDLHNIGTYLIINPDSNIHRAVGEVIYDFDDFDTIENMNFNRINIEFIYDTILFSSVNKTKDLYKKNDFFIEGIKLYNANYLTENGNYDILNIILNDDLIKNAKIDKINDEIYEIDLKKYKINFNQVKIIKFIQSNENTTNYITK
jgi:alpha-glucosidase (family GH31 glycosyl hydrolase)